MHTSLFTNICARNKTVNVKRNVCIVRCGVPVYIIERATVTPAYWCSVILNCCYAIPAIDDCRRWLQSTITPQVHNLNIMMKNKQKAFRFLISSPNSSFKGDGGILLSSIFFQFLCHIIPEIRCKIREYSSFRLFDYLKLKRKTLKTSLK